MRTLKAHDTYWNQPKIVERDIKVPPSKRSTAECMWRWQEKLNHHGLAVLMACMWCHCLVSWEWDDDQSLDEVPKGYKCPKCHRTWQKAESQ